MQFFGHEIRRKRMVKMHWKNETHKTWKSDKQNDELWELIEMQKTNGLRSVIIQKDHFY